VVQNTSTFAWVPSGTEPSHSQTPQNETAQTTEPSPAKPSDTEDISVDTYARNPNAETPANTPAMSTDPYDDILGNIFGELNNRGINKVTPISGAAFSQNAVPINMGIHNESAQLYYEENGEMSHIAIIIYWSANPKSRQIVGKMYISDRTDFFETHSFSFDNFFDLNDMLEEMEDLLQ
jgi:hypothetical protein